jgi:succinyl-CoA synthetase alpha subunit/citrate synthase
MKAKKLSDLLAAGDRVAVSNITGREASKVTEATLRYCRNIVAGWALGKGGQEIRPEDGGPRVPVFATFQEMMEQLPAGERPNKAIVYSPPEAVYGEVKEIAAGGSGKGRIETIFIITEHVAVEVTAKIRSICSEAGVDVVGCNTLGIINVHDHVRVGAVGGEDPEESFVPGSVTIISNSGNMVNTMASYLLSAGMGTSFGCSTGKDALILTPPGEFIRLAAEDAHTRLAVLYVEPGGLYEKEALETVRAKKLDLPMVVYVAGKVAEGRRLSLGHAGAVVEGPGTSATGKMKLFDEYFGVEPFDPEKGYPRAKKLLLKYRRGIRVTALHHLPLAMPLLRAAHGWDRDFRPRNPLTLNPWMMNLRDLDRRLPRSLILHPGSIPEPYGEQVRRSSTATIGAELARRDMRSASHASSIEAEVPRVYGRSLVKLMEEGSFARALILAWTGEEPRHDFEAELVERCLIAAITNGPGTISAQAAKLSTSAGNPPNAAMIATLASIGRVHGGNGAEAVHYLARVFGPTALADPYAAKPEADIEALADAEIRRFATERAAAKEAGIDYARIPCLGHPVYRDKDVNFDPRERAVAAVIEAKGLKNCFLEFYHLMAIKLRDSGVTKVAMAVNVDAAIATVWLGISWPLLREKRMTLERAADLPFLAFALGRAAGGASEFLDHQDHGQPMDMRIPAGEVKSLTRAKD